MRMRDTNYFDFDISDVSIDIAVNIQYVYLKIFTHKLTYRRTDIPRKKMILIFVTEVRIR